MADEMTKDTEFFLNPNIRQEVQKDLKNYDSRLSEINLEVQAYGSFRPKQLFQKFVYAAITYLKHFKDLSIIKIEIAGFAKDSLLESKNTISQIIDQISQSSGKDLRRVVLNFQNFLPGTLKDFNRAIALASNPNFIFEEVFLNFSNWQMDLDIKAIEIELRPLFQLAKFNLGIDFFKLEMSGWYYKNYNPLFGDYNGLAVDAKVFKQKVGKLHETVKSMFEALFKVCKTEVVVDFRNWNEALDMVNMKKKVDKLTKEGSYEKSLVQTKTEESKLFKFTFLV